MIVFSIVTLLGTMPAHARIAADKKRHFSAGFTIAIVTNVILQKWTRLEYTVPAHLEFNPLSVEGLRDVPTQYNQPFVTRTDGKQLGPFERAIFSALVAGIGGAVYEYVNRRESIADPNDAIATLLGGVGAGLFTITIGF